jgi:RNA polymerase sigma factor (TIGR02999 family)
MVSFSFMSDATRLIEAVGKGDPHAAEELLPLVYDELRKLAHHRMTSERADHTLQATGLVHEAYLRLVDNNEVEWANRAHFFHAAAEAMRRILIEHARAKAGPNRGGGRQRVPLDVLEMAAEAEPAQILALDEAISRLEQKDADAARIVRLRFYAGLTIDEVAKAMGTSPRTIDREWSFARAFLIRALNDC